jgi:hypothetical protein
MYVWNYDGGCLSLNYEYDDPETKYFYIANKNNTESILLLDNSRLGNKITISKIEETYNVSDESGTTSITLGVIPEFIFKFSADGTTFSYAYSLIPVDTEGKKYTLSNSFTGMAVGLSCSLSQPTVNEVPVPSAALLLGSGFLGLIGIRSHRQ